MLIIDVGQSGSRVKHNGEIITLARGKYAGESIIDSLHAIAEMLPVIKCEVVALSLTGLYGDVGDPMPFQALAEKYWGATSTVVIDDGLASFIGSLGDRDGVSLTLGGGVVAVGGRSGNFSHADGLGSTFGDEGSGYWLGARALTRVLATRDGRDDSHELTEYFKSEISIFDQLAVKNSNEAFVLAIQSAEKVLAAADSGIIAAINIREEGAKLLAKTVSAAWQKAGGGLTEAPLIAIAGGLANNANYVNSVMAEVQRAIPKAEMLVSIGHNLNGAEFIAKNILVDKAPLMRWAGSAVRVK